MRIDKDLNFISTIERYINHYTLLYWIYTFTILGIYLVVTYFLAEYYSEYLWIIIPYLIIVIMLYRMLFEGTRFLLIIVFILSITEIYKKHKNIPSIPNPYYQLYKYSDNSQEMACILHATKYSYKDIKKELKPTKYGYYSYKLCLYSYIYLTEIDNLDTIEQKVCLLKGNGYSQDKIIKVFKENKDFQKNILPSINNKYNECPKITNKTPKIISPYFELYSNSYSFEERVCILKAVGYSQNNVLQELNNTSYRWRELGDTYQKCSQNYL